MSAGVVWEPSTAGVVGQATGIAKATGIVMQADVAVEGVEAVVETVVLAFVDDVTSVATSVAEARLEEGVVAVEVNGTATVWVATVEAEADGAAVESEAKAEAVRAAAVLEASRRRLGAGSTGVTW